MASKKRGKEFDCARTEPIVPTRPDVRNRRPFIIGPTLKFNGNLPAIEDLTIEGTIAHQNSNLTAGREGHVKADNEGSRQPCPLPSIIGSTVVMKGELFIGEDLVIEGTFDGRIVGKGPDTVTVRRTARLRGEVSVSNVRVDDGTNLENTILSGRIGRTDL